MASLSGVFPDFDGHRHARVGHSVESRRADPCRGFLIYGGDSRYVCRALAVFGGEIDPHHPSLPTDGRYFLFIQQRTAEASFVGIPFHQELVAEADPH
jgi:hypothetical protein